MPAALNWPTVWAQRPDYYGVPGRGRAGGARLCQICELCRPVPDRKIVTKLHSTERRGSGSDGTEEARYAPAIAISLQIGQSTGLSRECPAGEMCGTALVCPTSVRDTATDSQWTCVCVTKPFHVKASKVTSTVASQRPVKDAPSAVD